jgi:tRNA dimethylallyltransferase
MGVNPFVLIVGSTATGKSALAELLSVNYSGAILNCDSLQVYRRLDIGTAKPRPAQQAKVPHFLFDIRGPGEVLTAGDFRKLALEVLERELTEHIVFGVGGSGFYIQALEKGMYDVEKPDPKIDRAVREELSEKGLAWMYARLQSQDPEYAEILNPNDSYRIVRALVMIRSSGKTVTELRAGFRQSEFPFPLLKLGVSASREELLPRVERRVKDMFAQGFLDEVRALVEEGYADWPPLQSVGYKECLRYLRGEITYGELPSLIVEKTMQLAKKQRTWFRRDAGIHWLNMENPLPEALRSIDDFLARIPRRSVKM